MNPSFTVTVTVTPTPNLNLHPYLYLPKNRLNPCGTKVREKLLGKDLNEFEPLVSVAARMLTNSIYRPEVTVLVILLRQPSGSKTNHRESKQRYCNVTNENCKTLSEAKS